MSFQVNLLQNLCLAPISRLFPNISVTPGYKPAPDTLIPNNKP